MRITDRATGEVEPVDDLARKFPTLAEAEIYVRVVRTDDPSPDYVAAALWKLARRHLHDAHAAVMAAARTDRLDCS